MEIGKQTYRRWNAARLICLASLLFAIHFTSEAQAPVKSYTVKDGKMFIAVSKMIPEASLDSFISQYDLYDLSLKDCLDGARLDSLKKLGWRLEVNNSQMLVISKPMRSFNEITNPADKIIFAEQHNSFAEMFPSVSNKVVMGTNQFQNKHDFAIKDSQVTFFLRNQQQAKRVMLAGSFNDWSPDNLAMKKTDSGWIAFVKLGVGKYWYKFIVDHNWAVDKDNKTWENDGLGNNNSVFYKTNMVFKLAGYQNAKKVFVAGSFNGWQARDLPMRKTATGWELPIYLADGTHTYRFIVDGKWMIDPANPDKLPNEYREYNSVIYLGKPYLFQLEGYPNAKQVILSGSFNNWRRDELFMKKTGSGWQLPYALGPGNFEYEFIVDGENIYGVSEKKCFVIEPNYTFRLKAFPNAKKVFLAGDFNGWSPNTYSMKKTGNEWELSVHLSPGKHLYKFVVDGKWMVDPTNTLWEQNEHGTGNSVIWKER